jgi:L-serine dehydratase
VGPSSSHTLGPWNAAIRFTESLENYSFNKIQIHLYGSLSKTGKGHATDKAVQLGLMGFNPSQIDTQLIPRFLKKIAKHNRLDVIGKPIQFSPANDIIFHKKTKRKHPNTLTFTAYNNEEEVKSETYYSTGGGFIQKKGKADKNKQFVTLPFPIETAAELIKHVESTDSKIAEIVFKNETYFDNETVINQKLDLIFHTMVSSVYKGCTTGGILPGGLNVKRRAKALCDELLQDESFNTLEEWKKLVFNSSREFNYVNKWVSCFALAVNEENAAMGRIVTSPTNGAAGVIPAVLLYYYFFCKKKTQFDFRSFLCTAGEIGSLFKKRATISAAVGGCQAEIGVSSAMAAAGLTEVLGGSPKQVLMAAEIAMEHHLGLTCDPVGGLVQIPCIERNAMGAMKAITACNLALSSNPDDSKVQLDTVIKTMWDTAKAMNKKYKETSEGGLAYNLPVILPEC